MTGLRIRFISLEYSLTRAKSPSSRISNASFFLGYTGLRLIGNDVQLQGLHTYKRLILVNAGAKNIGTTSRPADAINLLVHRAYLFIVYFVRWFGEPSQSIFVERKIWYFSQVFFLLHISYGSTDVSRKKKNPTNKRSKERYNDVENEEHMFMSCQSMFRKNWSIHFGKEKEKRSLTN